MATDEPEGRPAFPAPRISTSRSHAYPWYVRLILALQRRKYGAELEPARLWGRMPLAFVMLTLLYRTLDRPGSPIEPALRALVQVRVSQINGCAFCVDLNGAEALTDPTWRVDDACFATLRAHFDEQAVLELTALAAFQNLSSKFNAALGVPAHGLRSSTRPAHSPSCGPWTAACAARPRNANRRCFSATSRTSRPSPRVSIRATSSTC